MATRLTVAYDAPARWSAWPGALKFYEPEQAGETVLGGHVGLSIVTVTNDVTMQDHRAADPAVGPTVDDLATALAGLAPFEVTAPATDVTVVGYEGMHLRLTVPDIPAKGEAFTSCSDGAIHSWIAPMIEGSFYGYNASPVASRSSGSSTRPAPGC